MSGKCRIPGFALHVQIHLPPNEKKSSGSEHDFQKSATASELDRACARRELAGEFPSALCGIEPHNDGQFVTPQAFNIIRLKPDVRINPQRLSETVLNGGNAMQFPATSICENSLRQRTV